MNNLEDFVRRILFIVHSGHRHSVSSHSAELSPTTHQMSFSIDKRLGEYRFYQYCLFIYFKEKPGSTPRQGQHSIGAQATYNLRVYLTDLYWIRKLSDFSSLHNAVYCTCAPSDFIYNTGINLEGNMNY